MFFDINVTNIIYTSVFLVFFLISYLLIIASRFEQLFKQGKILEIRIAQVLFALIVAYLLTKAVMGLVNATQFSLN